MTRQPCLVLLVRVQIVEDHLEAFLRVGCHDIVHEGQELLSAPALLVLGLDLAGGHLEGGEQGRGAVALVVVAVPGQRASVRQLQIALGALQSIEP